MTATRQTPPADPTVLAMPTYVGGGWRPAAAAESITSVDPATSEIIGHVPLCGADDVDVAVRAARAASPAWRETSPLVRARALIRLQTVLRAHQAELATLVMRDMGKTEADAFAEVGRGIESIEAAIGAPHLLKGENLEQIASGVDVHMVRQPVGVVAAITPFNFPAMIPLWFLPFAVACGNTFILKPSELDPTPAVRIFELIHEQEIFPSGVVNLVHGAHDAVNALLDHPDVDAISFVGSAATARYVAGRAIASGKRVQALGGAKNAMIVMPDARPELMVRAVLGSAFGAAGQRCLAGPVAILVGSESEQDLARDRLLAGASELVAGSGSDPATDIPPVVSTASRERLEREIALAAEEGELLLDGRLGASAGSAQLGPTIVDHIGADARATREELFGPILALVRVPDLDAAVEWTNRSRYGNAAMIFTASGESARQFRRTVEAGMLGVNVGVPAPVAWFPFSGWKDSIDGDLHANGQDAVEFYTRKKVVTERW